MVLSSSFSYSYKRNFNLLIFTHVSSIHTLFPYNLSFLFTETISDTWVLSNWRGLEDTNQTRTLLINFEIFFPRYKNCLSWVHLLLIKGAFWSTLFSYQRPRKLKNVIYEYWLKCNPFLWVCSSLPTLSTVSICLDLIVLGSVKMVLSVVTHPPVSEHWFQLASPLMLLWRFTEKPIWLWYGCSHSWCYGRSSHNTILNLLF